MLYGRTVIGTVGIMGGIDRVPTDFAVAFANLRGYTERHVLRTVDEIVWLSAYQSYHATARNWMAEHSQGEWLLMLDTDQTFEPDLLRRMLGHFYAHKLDILTGVYYQRAHPWMPVLWRWDPDGTPHYQFVTGIPDDRLVRIDSAGAGCLLIRRSVFARLKEIEDKPPFEPFDGFSEDFSFFERCRRAGIQSYCAPMLETTHLMQRTVTREDHNAVASTLRGIDVEADTLPVR